MAKLPARRVPSDDFAVRLGGVDYHTHEGEWVEIIAAPLQLRHMRAYSRLGTLGVELEAAQADPEADAAEQAAAQLKLARLMDENFDLMLSALTARVVAWNWTDDFGRPLPAPDGSSAPFEALSAEELHYLMGLVQAGESQDERKNGSRAMPTAVSATARARSRS